ncbi:MAG TPA: hypothetical protein VH478_06005 [Trebonia sp.]|nr:hypothetical protein [Trebonia sp.]
MTFILGAIAWLTARSPQRRPWAWAGTFDWSATVDWSAAEASLARHPAGRDRRPATRGPDDDPAFLRSLEQTIREG